MASEMNITFVPYIGTVDVYEPSNLVKDTGYLWLYLAIGLFALAWVVITPVAVLFARHKWLFKDSKCIGLHIWFHMHRSLQLLAGVVLIASGVLWVMHINVPPDIVGRTFYYLGIAVMASTFLQHVGTLVRPYNIHQLRPKWNAFHKWLGILTLFAAWADVFLAIYVMHMYIDEPYVQWLVPVCAIMFMIIVLDISLRYMLAQKLKKRQEDVEADRGSVGVSGSGGFVEMERVQSEGSSQWDVRSVP